MTARKSLAAALFVALLTVPAVLGAIPFTLQTPLGTVSTEIGEAQARVRNTSNNRLRNLRVPTSSVSLAERFAPNRTSYRINVRQDIGRVQLRPTRDNSRQNVRHRIDSRRANGTWNNGNWSRWRSGSNFNNNISVNISQGQERRVRIAVRDANRNVRTYTVNLRRASGNTFASSLFNDIGLLSPNFNRATGNYALTIPSSRPSAHLRLDREHHNAQMRVRVNSEAWSGWSNSNLSRNVNVPEAGQSTISFQIRGAWTNLVSSPTRTRTYVVTLQRAAPTNTQRRAIDLARAYMGNFNLSRAGLIDALMNGGFSRNASTFAADYLNVNWNAEAAQAARDLLRQGNFSRRTLIAALESKGFTQGQATHGADNAGANWNQEAVDAARHYRSLGFTTRRQIIDKLIAAGFTSAQANHAANQLNLR